MITITLVQPKLHRIQNAKHSDYHSRSGCRIKRYRRLGLLFHIDGGSLDYLLPEGSSIHLPSPLTFILLSTVYNSKDMMLRQKCQMTNGSSNSWKICSRGRMYVALTWPDKSCWVKPNIVCEKLLLMLWMLPSGRKLIMPLMFANTHRLAWK